MRILLDENVTLKLKPILSELGHDVVAIKASPHRGSTDHKIVQLAKSYDVLITLDLHRKELEWLVVNHALFEGSIKVVRIAIAPTVKDQVLAQVQSVIARMDFWMAELQRDKCLASISSNGMTIRFQTSEQVLSILRARAMPKQS